MSIRLLVKQRSQAGGADQGTEVLLEDESITLGRDKSCEVVLAEQAVSRSHARIRKEGNLFFIEDLGSSFGTEVNGARLSKGEKRLLRNGDTIAIAQFDVIFDRLAQTASGGSEKTSAVARQIVKHVMGNLGETGPFFRIMNGPQEGMRIELLDAQELILGRDPSADIILEDDLVSRRHAKIRRDWSGTHVEDLQSRNGVLVNGKLTPYRTLKDRDEVKIGGVRLLYLDATAVREPSSDIPVAPPEAPPQPPEPEEEQGEASAESPSEESSEAAAEPAAEAPAEVAAPPEPAPAPDAEAPEEPAVETSARSRWIALGAMALFGLVALAVIIAVLAGA
jgi:pSer/pThr/pTyr-binding forkhead associated (FHA) protein